jgi:hypothetical protein
MQAVRALNAKTHLSALLDRVAKGERITITRRGIPAGWRRLRTCGSLRSPHSRDIEAADIEKHVCASHEGLFPTGRKS